MEENATCIWKVAPEDRRCEFCSYRGGCEKYRFVDGVKMGVSPMLETYIEVMNEIVGADVMQKSRKSDLVYGRYIIAYQLAMDHYGHSAIARMLHLHHATVLYAINKVQFMLSEPMMFPSECKFLNKFINRLKDVKEISEVVAVHPEESGSSEG